MRQINLPVKGDVNIFVVKPEEREAAASMGVPYIVWGGSNDKLLHILMYRLLQKRFPAIDWMKRWHLERNNERPVCENGGLMENDGANTPDENADLIDFISSEYEVDIDKLMALNMLPKFIGDIANCIRETIVGHHQWENGYNKKLNCCVGNYDQGYAVRNLIIIDVSWSIPDSISSIMLSLADTLRTQCNADLIITGGRSKFYSMERELPDPETLRQIIPHGNESVMFEKIIKDKIAGKHWGHVISFGDYDHPRVSDKESYLANTVVDHVIHYHTGKYRASRITDYPQFITGYALWTNSIAKTIDYDQSWVRQLA